LMVVAVSNVALAVRGPVVTFMGFSLMMDV
jgi:hypothetical protein